MGLHKKAKDNNDQLDINIMNSDNMDKAVDYYIKNYITTKETDQFFDQKRNKKQSDQIIEISDTIRDVEKKQKKGRKEQKSTPKSQYVLDF